MVDAGQTANKIAKWRMFIKLKKWMFETKILEFPQIKAFKDMHKFSNIPYSVLWVPKDI